MCLVLCAAACAPGRLSTDISRPTNLELLCSSVVECIGLMSDSLRLDPALFRVPERPDSACGLIRFLDHCAAEALIIRGWRRVEDGGLPCLSWLPVAASVQYAGSPQNASRGSGAIKRKASVSILFRIKQEGRSVDLGRFSAEKADVLPRSALYAAEQNGLLIGRPPLPDTAGFMSWMEPLLALVLAGTLGYLFYTIRSRS
ncbi:hypothetical protein JW906_07925 [bacterium]|nr:hypothetical protein [bacterium]